MSSHEFSEWMAFLRLQPFGEQRKDLRMATLAAVITNVMTRTKDSDPVAEVKDFMPDFEKALDEHQAQEEIPEHEMIWRKIDLVFGAMAKKSKTPNPASPKKRKARGLGEEKK